MKSIKSLLAIVIIIAASLPSFGQSVESIAKIRQAQDLVVERIVSSLNTTNRACSNTGTAIEVKNMTDALIVLQAAESRAYSLANERDAAPQTMTQAAMTRSLAEAKELGVGRSLRNNLQQEWSHARTLEQADRLVASVQHASADRMTVVADRGSFRRFLPEFLGGTSSYANYRAPQPENTEAALATKVHMLEQRVSGLQATITIPTVQK